VGKIFGGGREENKSGRGGKNRKGDAPASTINTREGIARGAGRGGSVQIGGSVGMQEAGETGGGCRAQTAKWGVLLRGISRLAKGRRGAPTARRIAAQANPNVGNRVP